MKLKLYDLAASAILSKDSDWTDQQADEVCAHVDAITGKKCDWARIVEENDVTPDDHCILVFVSTRGPVKDGDWVMSYFTIHLHEMLHNKGNVLKLVQARINDALFFVNEKAKSLFVTA